MASTCRQRSRQRETRRETGPTDRDRRETNRYGGIRSRPRRRSARDDDRMRVTLPRVASPGQSRRSASGCFGASRDDDGRLGASPGRDTRSEQNLGSILWEVASGSAVLGRRTSGVDLRHFSSVATLRRMATELSPIPSGSTSRRLVVLCRCDGADVSGGNGGCGASRIFWSPSTRVRNDTRPSSGQGSWRRKARRE